MANALRTPFGLALQGIRDEPIRMASLGFTVPLHRMLAFTFAATFRWRHRRLARQWS